MNRILTTLLAWVLLVAAGTALAAPSAGANFRALSAQQAASFRVPADMALVAQGVAGRDKLRFERYQQKFGDAEVLGGQLTIYRDASGAAVAIIGNHFPAINALNTPRLAAGQAQAVAVKQVGGDGEWRTRLMIDASNGRYFYEVENRRFDSRWFHWVDAETGDIVNAYDGLAHEGSGTGVLGDTKNLTGLTTYSGGKYQLVSADARQKTYDARNRNSLPGTLATDSDDLWNTAGRTSPGQAALVDAQFYARVTDNYYLNVHGFNWTDHYSQGMVSSAHLQRNYNNAYWNGTQMAYGDGDGTNFIEFSADLDVVGHELTHGVTEATSNLIYRNESGALNEAFSDIMGTAVEYYYGTGNWSIGEDVGIGAYDDGIRSMEDPTDFGDPSHYADRYTGTGDNGGVHINSGIANHWFYLLVNGGQNAKATRASGANVHRIGLAAAEDIAYLGFTALPSNANFCAARASTVAVAGANEDNVADAWDEVGVDSALCDGGGTDPVDGPTITTVESRKLRGGKFQITWTTDVPADSAVIFTCCGAYTNASLVTQHKMQFNGSIGATYEYFVESAANGSTTRAGPFTHQN